MKKIFFLLSISFAIYNFAIDEHIDLDTHLDEHLDMNLENPSINEINKNQTLDFDKNDILLEILDYPKNVLPGSSYDIKLKLLNNTNAAAVNEISIDQLKECKYQFSEDLPIELKPLEEKLITIKIDTPNDLKEEMINNVQIKNKTLNSDLPETNLLATTEIKPEILKTKVDKEPSILTSFGYDLNESVDSQLYLESSGSKLLNSKDINLEYALKIPMMVEGTIPKKLDGKPKTFYLGYKTDNYNILVGDTEYKISPLTISPFSDTDDPAPLGRGSLITFNRNKLGVGLLYLNKPPFETSNKSNSFLGFLSYKLLNNKFSANVLNTSYKKPLSKNEQIYSLRSTYDENDCLYDFEYANSSLKKNQDAYFFTAKDKLSFLSYIFNGYLAKPKFSGYLSDRSVFNSLAQIAISKNLKIAGAYKLKNTNLDKNIDLKNAKRDFAVLAKITFVAPFKLSSDLVYENIVKKDALVSGKNNKLDKFALIFSQPIDKFTLESTLAKGKYSAQKESYLKRDYNRVDFKVDYAFLKNQNITAFTKIGNFIDSDIYNFGYIYGLKTEIKPSDNLNFSFLYEFARYTRKNLAVLSSSVSKIKKTHKIDSSFNLKLPTNHEVKFKAKFNPMKFSTKTSEIGLSYSIPYDMPWIEN